MNKYERLFSRIFAATTGKLISWTQTPRSANSDYIFNSSFVLRQFVGRFEDDGSVYDLIYVEKKVPDPDFDYIYDQFQPELLVFQGQQLLLTLTDSLIDRESFRNLAHTIESSVGARARLLR
jgi:hypothetical protein